MKTLTVTTWERVKLLQFIQNPEQRGNFRKLARAIKLFDILELSDAEKEEAGWSDSPLLVACPNCRALIPSSENGAGAGRWTNTTLTFELEFEDADFEMIAGAPSFTGWPMSAARLLLPLLEKIKRAA